MPVTTSQTLGTSRVGIEKWVRIMADQDSTFMQLFNEKSTTQSFDRMKQITDFGLPRATTEGAPGVPDMRAVLYQADFTPVEFTKLFKITYKGEFTDQYGLNQLDSIKGEIRDTFVDNRSYLGMRIFNNAFSASYTGIDTVSLCSTAHAYRSYGTWSNRPATDISLSYPHVGQALNEMQVVKTARNRQMRLRSGCYLVVPPNLQFTAMAIETSAQRPDNANNEDNKVKNRITTYVSEDLSSTTAWFLVAKDKKKHGLFRLNQMPITLLMDQDWDTVTRSKMVSFFESLVFGWEKAHGVWGTTG